MYSSYLLLHCTMAVSSYGTMMESDGHIEVLFSTFHDLSFSSFACRWSCHASWCSDRRPDHKGDDHQELHCDEV